MKTNPKSECRCGVHAFLGPLVNPNCPIHSHTPKLAEWEKEFDVYFQKIVIGTLSDGKNSPVFVNNELEVPRLKSFIQTLLSQARREERESIIGEIKQMYPYPENPPIGHDTDNDEYRFGYSGALADVLKIITNLKMR